VSWSAHPRERYKIRRAKQQIIPYKAEKRCVYVTASMKTPVPSPGLFFFILFYDGNALFHLLKTFFSLSFVTIWDVPM
jgi:hypothetical protein